MVYCCNLELREDFEEFCKLKCVVVNLECVVVNSRKLERVVVNSRKLECAVVNSRNLLLLFVVCLCCYYCVVYVCIQLICVPQKLVYVRFVRCSVLYVFSVYQNMLK